MKIKYQNFLGSLLEFANIKAFLDIKCIISTLSCKKHEWHETISTLLETSNPNIFFKLPITKIFRYFVTFYMFHCFYSFYEAISRNNFL